jgi:hypothetical protein
LPPQGPVFTNPYDPYADLRPTQTPEPPKRSRKKLVLIVLALLFLLGALGASVWVAMSQEKEGAGNNAELDSDAADEKGHGATGNLRVGPYYYVAACNAFTSEDFAEATGVVADDSSVKIDYATNTYPVEKKDRSILSSCSRYETETAGDDSLLSVDVYIRQFPDSKRTRDQMLIVGLHQAKVDDALGGKANFRAPTLNFESGNRLVTITIQGYGGMTDSEIKKLAYAAGEKVSEHLHAKDQKALTTFEYPETVQAPSIFYRNACSLWGPDEFTKQFGKVDESEIEMLFATSISEAQQTASLDKSVKTTCVLGSYTKNPATDPPDHAYIEIDYYPGKEQAEAGYAAYSGSADRTELAELGDKAIQVDDQFIILKNNTMIRVQFKPHDDTSAKSTDLLQMAQTIMSKLQ